MRPRLKSQLFRNLGIVLVGLMAVTAPLWGVFVGGMMRAGDYGAALGMLGIFAGFALVPIVIVAVAVAVFMRLARRAGWRPHAMLVAGLGAVAGVAIVVAYSQSVGVAALFGALPGAVVALALLPRPGPAEFVEDGDDG